MVINWKKVLFDCLKVLLGAIVGSSVSGCASVPVFFF